MHEDVLASRTPGQMVVGVNNELYILPS